MRPCLAAAAISLAAMLAGCGFSVATTSPQADRRTPLEKAAQEGDAAELKRLLVAGADPNDASGFFGSPVTAASFKRGNAEVVRLLLAARADPNGRAPEGNRCWTTPLWHATLNGDVETARLLLDAGASLRNQPRCSPLQIGWLEPAMLDLLASRGLDLKAVDPEGRNPLHLALAPPGTPRPATIDYLVRAGLPVNARDNRGKTPRAYWQEPRDAEVHWFRTWLFDKLTGDSESRQVRAARAEITSILDRAGATP